MHEKSALTPIGYGGNACGYCKGFGSFSYYARSTELQPKLYQDLLNRGWRRSGTLLYKPDQVAACCPQYTIRLEADAFHASKTQRQSQNRFNNYVLGDEYNKDAARLYPKSREQAKKRNTDYDLVERVHESEKEYIRTPPEPAHALMVSLESDKYTDEKYALFENYQRIVHHEPPQQISKSGFKSFLCKSPLSPSTETINGKVRKLGSFHQCYRLDGKLVAIGVLDLLPHCVSAVYFMYHESVHQYGFGKLGALREIALAKEGGYKFWYAGFYIHSCVKMRYKGDYSPQYVLDPDTYAWDLLDEEVKRRMEDKKFVSMSRDRAKDDTRSPPNGNETSLDSTEEAIDPSEGPSASEERPIKEDAKSDADLNLESDDDLPDPHTDLALWERAMPGLLTSDQLASEIDLGEVHIEIGGEVYQCQDLVRFEGDIVRIVSELVCVVGVDIGKEMVIRFT